MYVFMLGRIFIKHKVIFLPSLIMERDVVEIIPSLKKTSTAYPGALRYPYLCCWWAGDTKILEKNAGLDNRIVDNEINKMQGV